MVQKINVTRNKICIDDLEVGTGTVQQVRGGQTVTLNKVNAANLPFDETKNLATAMLELEAATALLTTYGSTLTSIANNITHILNINEVAVIGTDGNAGYLSGQTLAQVRANIDAITLSGQTLAQVKANIDAITLSGQTLAQVKEGGNAATLGGSTLTQVRTGIDAATLGGSTLTQVRTGIDAATLEGSTLTQVVSAATVGDATTTVKGKVLLSTSTLAKGGSDTATVTTPADVSNNPKALAGYGVIDCGFYSSTAAVLSKSSGISSVGISSTGMLTINLDRQVSSGFAEVTVRINNNASNGNVSSTYSINWATLTDTAVITLPVFVGNAAGQLYNITCFAKVYGVKN